MHKQVKQFCKMVREKYPEKFKDVDVIDAGSLDVNGNNRYLFDGGTYKGIDIERGPNVDVKMPIHAYWARYKKQFDVAISTEMLEHDPTWKESIRAMYDMTRSGGLVLITCATVGRKPHHSEYYLNISKGMFLEAIEGMNFEKSELIISRKHPDLYFYGIKK